MKRTLITLMFLATFGVALAGPPVDYQLVCGEGEEAPLVGVASLVDDQLHVALIEGAIEECDDGVYGVLDGETLFTVSYFLDGEADDVQVEFYGTEYLPTLTYAEVPDVAVEGMLGAHRLRQAAFERAAQAREQASEHAGGPPIDVPAGGDDREELAGDDPEMPVDLPAPASRGRR